jgi:hypothetical protein
MRGVCVAKPVGMGGVQLLYPNLFTTISEFCSSIQIESYIYIHICIKNVVEVKIGGLGKEIGVLAVRDDELNVKDNKVASSDVAEWGTTRHRRSG